ncbi:MAG: hypothetical protein GY828_01705 [Candidatus Gracilibacteria bacterium]|nr:hypothetical protein [Candidatus Gracilibacteria bacterium]
MTEFAPPGSGARMTAAQVRKYVQDMKKAQEIAKKKLNEAQNSGDLEKEKQELEDLENKLDQL